MTKHLLEIPKNATEVQALDKEHLAALEQYMISSLPVNLANFMADWSLMQELSFKSIAVEFGANRIEVRRCTDPHELKVVTVADFIDYCLNNDDNDPYYWNTWQFSLENQNFFSSYEGKNPFENWLDLINPEEVPQLKWIITGGKRTFSPMHLDVLNTSAWNGLICGRKKWLFLPQDNKFSPPLFLIQDPGDIVFTPSGWLHQVENLEPSICVTENFVNQHNCDTVAKTAQGTHLSYLSDVVQILKARRAAFQPCPKVGVER